MESSLEFEIVRIRSKERMRRNALGPEDIKYLQGMGEEEEYDEEYEKENSAPCLRDKTKNRLQRLGVLYGDGEVSSPIHRSEEHFIEDQQDDGRGGPLNDKYSEQRSKRFRALASTINSWEDDIRHISPKKEEPEKFDRFGNKVGTKAVKHDVVQPAAGRGLPPQSPSPTKKVAWDRKIINTLESQGFKRCDSEEHLVYDYVSPENKECTSPRKTPGRRNFPPPARAHPSPPRKAADTPKSAFIASRQTAFLGNQAQEEQPAKKFAPLTPQAPRKVLEEIPLRKVDEAREVFQDRSRSVSPQRPLSPHKSTSPVRRPQSPMKPTSPVRRPQSPMKPTSPVRRPPSPQKSAVLEMAAQFEVNTGPPKPARSIKDPALLSVAEKRAVFEKNTGFVPIPQAPLAQAPVPQGAHQRDRSPVRRHFPPEPVATLSAEERSPIRHNVNQAVIDRFKEIEALRHRWDRNKAISTMEEVLENRTPTHNPGVLQPEPMEVQGTPKSIPAPPPLPHHILSPPSTASTPRGLPGPAFTPSPASGGKVRMGTRSPVRREAADSPPKRQLPRVLSIKEKSPGKRDCGYPDVKKIRVSPPKLGHIYPSVSDIETESEVPESDLEPIEEEGSEPEDAPMNTSFGFSSELDSSMGSLGQQIVRQASRTNLKRPSELMDTSDPESASSFSESESRVLREMDELLEEAMSGMPPAKRSRDSASSSEPNFETCSTASFEYSSSDNKPQPTTPLIHTVSVYRKQQHLSTTPTVRREVRTGEEYKPISSEAISSESTTEEQLVLDRIKELQTEIGKQLETISQASKALNLCHSTPGFSGSTAELEAQKLLLIANARWNAMNQEIDRLKVERRLKPGLPGRMERGDISLSRIALPLKSFQSSGNSAHSSVMVLVKSGATVLNTEVLTLDKRTIRDNRIHFEKSVTLKGLYSDFAASIEVYGYVPKKVEFACPDVKSHTPKKEKNKKTKEKSGFFPVESPAGPNVVRTSAFQLWGYAVFSLREVNRNSFTLNKVPYTCPLEGTLELTMTSSMQSQVEHAGFLTVYEDVSGFGAWKRRWAVLRGTSVAFWAYPDQYKEGKVAMDTIDLTTVTTEEASLAPRELCARPHTILLQSRVRDASIPESLVARREKDCTVLTYLLSADTKEERLHWCEQLNKVLHLLRAWKVSRS